jgi:hypothetical protein
MVKLKVVLVGLLIGNLCQAQTAEEYWNKWNTNYPRVDVLQILSDEKIYADSVESNPSIEPYYGRTDKYRFSASFTGKTRPLSKEALTDIKRIFKLFIGDPDQLDELFRNEALIAIGAKEFWMPIQEPLLKSLKKEIKKGIDITLYCLFLNEHSASKGLKNIFLISEFNRVQI